MCQQREQPLPCDAAAVSGARRFCAKSLNETVGSASGALDCIDAAILVISELATNAINAGCAHAVAMIDVHRHRVRIGVTDDGAGLPHVRHPMLREGHGRGLQIVDRLSLAWGVSPAPAGKLVWADLAVPAELTADLCCSLPGAE
jgi:anti-sigma regulatory factor (Ser/Thr protein kinase)